MAKTIMYRGVRYGEGFEPLTPQIAAEIGLSQDGKVRRPSSKKEQALEDARDDSGLPANIPGYDILTAAGFLNLAEVFEASDEELFDVEGMDEDLLFSINEFLEQNLPS